MYKRISIVALVLVAPCAAQSTVSPGMRVRLEAAGVVRGRLEGTVIAPVTDSLTLAAPARPRLSLPISSVTRLEAYRGRSVRAGVVKGATWGAIVGVPFGLFVCGFSDHEGSYASCVRGGIPTGVLLAGGTGALIGAGVRADQWEEMPVPRPSTVSSVFRLTRASAQVGDELQPGVRVRVRAPGVIAGELIGTIIRRTRDTLALADERGLQVAIPFAALSSVDISRGKGHSAAAVKGMAWGAGIGLVSGIAAASGVKSGDTLSKSEAIIGSTVGGAIVGAGIGALIGSERWERFQLPVHIAIARQRRGLSLGVSMSLPGPQSRK
jgi:hypothetical protein